MKKALIVGLGNPGKSYKNTRHNIGFEVIEKLAAKYGMTLKKESKFQGLFADGSLMLLEPLTFMNESGISVEAVIRYYQVDLARVLIVCDDVDLPFGHLRMKINSGPGGHNGLKSIEAHLQTNRYARLRIGVGDREEGELSDYVLGKFTSEEATHLPKILERAVHAVEIWQDIGITGAMNEVNRSSSDPSIGDENA